MKPAITIKTVKGKKYAQLRTIEGALIHLGPLSKKETWTQAYIGLDDEYQALAMKEMFSFESLANHHGINLYEAINQEHDDDVKEKYFLKAKRMFVQQEFLHALLRDKTLRNDPTRLEAVAQEAEVEFETHKKTAEIVGSSVKHSIVICSKSEKWPKA
jgi:hypothetical protein